MEPSSQMFGGTEECHSSESGWTMYIGSPMYGGDDDDHDGHSDDGDDGGDGDDDDDHDADSDDSMASDASSGPSTHQGRINPCGDGKVGNRLDKKENDGKCCLDKKAKKQMEKQKTQRRKEEEEEEEEEKLVFMAKKANDPVQGSGGKVRKNIWMGKRK